jgi:hypothetical protein
LLLLLLQERHLLLHLLHLLHLRLLLRLLLLVRLEQLLLLHASWNSRLREHRRRHRQSLLLLVRAAIGRWLTLLLLLLLLLVLMVLMVLMLMLMLRLRLVRGSVLSPTMGLVVSMLLLRRSPSTGATRVDVCVHRRSLSDAAVAATTTGTGTSAATLASKSSPLTHPRCLHLLSLQVEVLEARTIHDELQYEC